MSAPTFTADRWAHVAGLELGTATAYVEDLVTLGLAEHVHGNVHRLTPRGRKILTALRELPLDDEERAA
jgi:predicted transcriptional regulator